MELSGFRQNKILFNKQWCSLKWLEIRLWPLQCMWITAHISCVLYLWCFAVGCCSDCFGVKLQQCSIQDELRVQSVFPISTAGPRSVTLLTHLLRADYWEQLPQQPQDHMTDFVSSLHSSFCLPPSINCFILVGKQQNAFQTSTHTCVTCWVSSPDSLLKLWSLKFLWYPIGDRWRWIFIQSKSRVI